MVPWSALPALTALATDPADRDTAAAALEALRGVVASNAAFAAGQVRVGAGPRVEDCRGLLGWDVKEHIAGLDAGLGKGCSFGSCSAHVVTGHAGR